MDTAIRTWKRDGSRNVMHLDAAVANIASATEAATERTFIRLALLRGETIETPHARFQAASVAVQAS